MWQSFDTQTNLFECQMKIYTYVKVSIIFVLMFLVFKLFRNE